MGSNSTPSSHTVSEQIKLIYRLRNHRCNLPHNHNTLCNSLRECHWRCSTRRLRFPRMSSSHNRTPKTKSGSMDIIRLLLTTDLNSVIHNRYSSMGSNQRSHTVVVQ